MSLICLVNIYTKIVYMGVAPVANATSIIEIRDTIDQLKSLGSLLKATFGGGVITAINNCEKYIVESELEKNSSQMILN